METKLFKLQTCTTRIDFLNLILPRKGPKNEILNVIFSIPDSEKYTKFEIPKKSGGVREIIAPIPQLKEIQKHLADYLTNCYQELFGELDTYANGFLKNRSIITNAKNHRNKNFVLNLDLENFFPSITFGRVRNFFIKNKNFNLSKDISTLIAKIACYQGYLPQGSPCSPIISNFICQILDMKLGKLAQKNKCHYSRYADDITFSTNLKNFPSSIALLNNKNVTLGKDLVFKINHAGFNINKNKTRIYKKTERQEVTSLIVNKKVNVSRKYFDDTKAMALKYYMTGTCEINDEQAARKQILGRFNFINQIEKYNNKLFFKNNEKTLPKNLFTPGNDKPIGTNQKDIVYTPIQLTINSKYHTKSLNEKEKKPSWLAGYHIGYNFLSARERAYSKFLYYSTFIINEKPLIITEGKTDVIYIKSALKNLYKIYPDLIEKKGGKFEFKVSFYKYSKLNRYLLNLIPSGFGITQVLTPLYLFPKNSIVSNNPVILILDNEQTENKPLTSLQGKGAGKGKGKGKKKNYILKNTIINKQFSELNKFTFLLEESRELFDRLKKNKFFLLVTPLKQGGGDTEIEDLFQTAFLKNCHYSPNPQVGQIGKNELSEIVAANYKNIDFSGFKPLLDNLVEIITIVNKE